MWCERLREIKKMIEQQLPILITAMVLVAIVVDWKSKRREGE